MQLRPFIHIIMIWYYLHFSEDGIVHNDNKKSPQKICFLKLKLDIPLWVHFFYFWKNLLTLNKKTYLKITILISWNKQLWRPGGFNGLFLINRIININMYILLKIVLETNSKRGLCIFVGINISVTPFCFILYF